MKPRRKFAPTLLGLEGRVVLSHVYSLTAKLDLSFPPANVAQTISPSDMVPGAPAAPAGGNTFPLDISATLQAGQSVYEQTQKTESNSTTSPLVDELIVPNPATGGRTTTEWIQDNPNQPTSVEKVVNVKTVNGNTTTNQITTTEADGSVETEVATAVKSGNTTTHTNVTTLPGGTVQTNTYTDVQKGKRTLIENGSEPAPDGSIETYSGVQYTVGDKTYTIKTYRQPAGLVKTTENVVQSFGDAGQKEATITINPHGPEIITNSQTIVQRLNPLTS